MPETAPGLVSSLLKMKCPNCRKGDMFRQKGLFPLKHLLDMPERCPVCGQKMELEVGFYYGTGYVSYALTVAIIGIVFTAYALVFGLTYKDNSIFYDLGVSVAVVVVLQPWLMRISRVLYLYSFVKYGQGNRLRSEE